MNTRVPRCAAVACVAALVIIAVPAFAQSLPSRWAPNASANGRLVPRAVRDGTGGVFVSWQDQAGGVYSQRLTPDGGIEPGWPGAGTLVSAVGSTDNISIETDGAGGEYVAWDTGAFYGSVALSHVTASGAVANVWTSEPPQNLRGELPQRYSGGRNAPTKYEHGNAYPAMASDAAGGVFFAWQTNSWLHGSQILLERYAGAPPAAVWASPIGVVANAYLAQYPTLAADGSGGAYVAWVDGYSPTRVRVNHVDASGAIAAGWDVAGVYVCANAAGQNAPGVVSDGAGGAIVVWADSRDATHDQVYAQHVTANGALTWGADGVCVSSHTTSFGPNRFGAYGGADARHGAIVADRFGGAVIAWVDYGSGTTSGPSDVYAQRLHADGSIASGWPTDGVPISQEPGDQRLPVLAADGHGGVIAAWQDIQPSGDATLRWTQIDANAQAAPDVPAGGGVISATPDPAWAPYLCPDDANGAYVTWVDLADGVQNVYASHLLADAVLATPDAGHAAFALAAPRPNPARGALRAWFSLPSSAPARLELLDVAGRLVVSREVGSLGAGAHVVRVVDGSVLAPGVYLLRLTQGIAKESRRVVVVE